MSHSLIMSVKPHSNPSILVYDQNTYTHCATDTVKACGKLIDAIFKYAFNYKAPKRLHIKGRRYMYIPSEEYKLIRVKNF